MIGYPLDSRVEFEADGTPVYDRAITSAPLRRLYNMLFSDGVLPNPSTNMQVSAGEGMNVLVAPGFAICRGCLKLEEDIRELAIQAADATYDRIDTVVLRLNDNDDVRICDLYIVKGVAQSIPIRPALTRTESIWEIGLADLFISAGTSGISNQRITDTRYETERCGIISSISQFDTTTLYQQVQADLAAFQQNEQADILAWFEYIKGQLSEDAAVSLQIQIDSIGEKIGNTDISAVGDGTVTGAIAHLSESGGGDTGIDISFEDFEDLEEIAPDTNYYVTGAPGMNLGLSFFPDYTNVIREFTTAGDSWTATEDCVVAGYIYCNTENKSAVLKVEGVNVIATATFISSTYASSNLDAGFVYVKKGQTVTTGADGSYAVKAYKLQYGLGSAAMNHLETVMFTGEDVSVNTNSTQGVIIPLTIPDGCTKPIGIVGFFSGNTVVSVAQAHLVENESGSYEAHMSLYNCYDGTATCSPYVSVLFV